MLYTNRREREARDLEIHAMPHHIRRTTTWLVALTIVGCTLGQSRPVAAQFWGNGWGWGGGPYVDNRASTPAESYARGAADVIRSAGMANVMNSEAAINVEEARSANIDNRMKWTDTYFGMREKNKAYRDAERRPRASREDIYRWAKEGAPERPSESDLDPLTGTIVWPRGLQIAALDEDREKMDELFRERAKTGGSTQLQTVNEIRATTENMKQVLRDHIRDMPASDYIASTEFLEGLSYESQF
ncbi:MAG: hypothetical protein KDA63_18875 [Planctomycetales bacterium]|nr:hypothetical protein [Planctomycetales bacterium]